MRNNLRFIILFVSALVVDQITKAIFASRDFLFLGMHFHLVKNSGLSFALNFGHLTNISVVVLAFVIFGWYVWKNRHLEKLLNMGTALILAGAISNIFDRLYFGYVRDFWDVPLGFTFNLADVFIVLGIIIMLGASNSEVVVG